jgi:hypothetical protein
MRYLLVVLGMLSCPLNSAVAQVSIQIGLPTLSIGINLPVYPQLVLVPDYPVYYAPGVDSNYFFYDGMYWVYQGDNWYASSWYNGPWALVGPEFVPVYVLRIPVRYYRQPPAYFRGWGPDAPPRWGEHWGHDWERQHGGWDKWNRQTAPPPAPLPAYQREYSGNRYPHAEQQQALHSQNYRYQPREATVRQAYQQGHGGPAPSPRGNAVEPAARGGQQHDAQPTKPPATHAEPARTTPHEQPARAPEQDRGHQARGGAPEQDQGHQARGAAPEQKQGHQARGAAPEQNQGHQARAGASEQEKGQKGKGGAQEPKRDSGQPRGEERGSEHNR